MSAANVTPLRVIGTGSGAGLNVNIVSPNPLPTQDTNLLKNYGTWGYTSGIDGTIVITGSKRVIGIGVYSLLGGSFTINGGDTITIPSGVAFNIEPNGNLIDPTFIFTGTNTFVIETVS